MKESKLVRIAKKRFIDTSNQDVHLVEDKASNKFLNDLKKYPHAYVLACLMDRQIKAERAWIIPVEIKKIIGTFEISKLFQISLERYREIFKENKLHRFNDTMAEIFYFGVQDIINKYNGNASNIWKDNPSSSSVIYRFLEFKGSGVKISTMAANILARQFHIPFSDYYSIDISPDVHIKRVMKRMGFVPVGASTDMVIFKARELNPEFPGIIDFSCWEIGRNWCKSRNPNCADCIVNDECAKILRNDIKQGVYAAG